MTKQQTRKTVLLFSLISALLWSFIALRYLANAGEIEAFAYLYIALFWVGHFLTFSLVLMILPLTVFSFFLPRKVVFAIGIFLSLLFSLFLIADTVVYDQYRFHINKAMLGLFFGPASKDIFVFESSMYFAVFVAVLLLVAVIALSLFVAMKLAKKEFKSRWIFLSVFTVIVSYHLLHSWAKFASVQSITKLSIYLPLSHPLSLNRALKKWGFEVPEETKVASIKGGTLDYPKEPLTCHKDSYRNILIIAIDSWRADAFGKDVSPNIFSYAQNGDIFLDHFATANSTRTGIFAMFYGISGTYWHSFLGERKSPLLIDQLISSGYETAVFASANLTSPEFHQSVFVNIPDLQTTAKGALPHDRDKDITTSFLNFLDSRDKNKPFFGFLFYDSPHAYTFAPDFEPIFLPNLESINYLTLNNKSDKVPFMNRYKNSVAYTDHLISDILNRLKREGLDRDTVVIFTGDHAQEINDNNQNYWGHNGNFSRYQTQVPMIVVMPDQKGKMHHHRTSHFDIAPTLLSLELGCTNSPETYSSGAVIYDSSRRKPLLFASYSARAVVDKNSSIVIDSAGNLEYLDLDMNKIAPPANSSELIKSMLDEGRRFYK